MKGHSVCLGPVAEVDVARLKGRARPNPQKFALLSNSKITT